MSFEIEDDDSYNFSSSWGKKKPSGSGLFAFGNDGGDDNYDFEFDSKPSVPIKRSNSPPSSPKQKKHEVKQTTKSTTVSTSVNAMDRASDLLAKYTGKSTSASRSSFQARKPPVEYDENDISVSSDDEEEEESSEMYAMGMTKSKSSKSNDKKVIIFFNFIIDRFLNSVVVIFKESYRHNQFGRFV